jgi:hypothetical protein
MSPTPKALLRPAALAAALLVLPAAAPAPAGCGDDAVTVSVIAIHATDQNNDIDPKLESIAKEIQKNHPNLTGFQAGKMTKKNVAVGGRDDFDLGDDQSLRVAVQQKLDKEGRYEVTISPPQMGDITYRATCCGKFLPVITPVRAKNNELLIVGVSVQPCAGK